MMRWKFVVLFAAWVLLAPGIARSGESATPDDTALFLAGMRPSVGSPLVPLTHERSWQQHSNHFESEFEILEDRQLSKIRSWSATNLKTPQPVLFYMFSGPDFIYANGFFPNASTYVLSGLEPVGQIPDLTKMSRGSIWQGLSNIRTSLRSVLAVSFFLTLDMKKDLSSGPMAGTLPILYVFLARSKKTIHEVALIHLSEQGEVREGDGSAEHNAARGVKIVFTEVNDRTRTLYYFSTDLANDALKESGFSKFCKQLGEGDSFVKSASYLLHSDDFSQIRNFLLDNSTSILQDDSGIPVTYFDEKKWQLQPFGHYYGPISLFQNRYQPKLNQLYQKSHADPINFGIGYRWRPQESNLLKVVKGVSAVSSVNNEPSFEGLVPKKELGRKTKNGRKTVKRLWW
jgi:hypothetical protein